MFLNNKQKTIELTNKSAYGDLKICQKEAVQFRCWRGTCKTNCFNVFETRIIQLSPFLAGRYGGPQVLRQKF